MPPMPTSFDLAGRVALRVEADAEWADRLASLLDPFDPGPSETPGVPQLALRVAPSRAVRGERHNPAGDGTSTAVDDDRLVLLTSGAWCAVPAAGSDEPVDVTEDFPHGTLVGRVLRPALQTLLPGSGAVAVHGTAVETDAGAVIVAGWSESGKTEGALGLLEQGARFVSDKWSVVGADGDVSAFPIGVGIRRWVLPHLPRLRAALPRRARAQLAVASGTRSVVAPALARSWSGPVGQRAADTASRALALADRAALAPSELAAIYGRAATRSPLRVLALLETRDGDAIRVREEDPARAAERLARSAAYERREFFDLHDRAAFGGLARYAGARERIVASERALLEGVLRDVRVVTVEAPFPAAPPRLAEAIAGCL